LTHERHHVLRRYIGTNWIDKKDMQTVCLAGIEEYTKDMNK